MPLPPSTDGSIKLTSKAFKVNDETKSEVETLHEGDQIEVTFSLEELSNIGNGINIISGNFEYNDTLLELDEVNNQGQNSVWKYTYNKDTKMFTSDTVDNNLIKDQLDDILTLKFKVKNEIEFSGQESIETAISLKNIKAGTGKLRRSWYCKSIRQYKSTYNI